MIDDRFDVVVIGSGPAGQKAAVQAAKEGRSVLVIEREPDPGGCCVQQGTIPSKTLRETALALSSLRRRSGAAMAPSLPESTQVAALLTRLDDVVRAQQKVIAAQLDRNDVTLWHGRARFLSPRRIEVAAAGGPTRTVTGEIIVIATGSRPRAPADIPIDHTHVLDSDSILSMRYLPRSLTVLGGGVIASEYASVFAALGVAVTMVDRGARPVPFLDEELGARFTRSFEAAGGRFLGNRQVESVAWDGVAEVVTRLDGGQEVRSEKLLFALGREASLAGLSIGNAGLSVNARGLLEVDACCRTAVAHIYAVGDVIGPPSLASSAMEQGRRAMRHALGLEVGPPAETIPIGVYTIPEISSVGLHEAQAIERNGGAVVGRASFDEVARGQIAAISDGLLKMVADPRGDKLVGVQIVGEGATELIHVGQVALVSGWSVDQFVDNIFNFPTLAEAYRVAALDIVKRRGQRPARDSVSPVPLTLAG